MSSKKIALVLLGLLIVAGGTFFGLRHLRNSPAAHLKRADAYFDEEDYNEARIEYQNVLRKKHEHPHAVRRIAETWVKQGSIMAGLPYLAKTIELDPDDIEMRWEMAVNLLTIGDRKQAEKHAREILDRAPKHELAFLMLANSRSSEDSHHKDLQTRLEKLNPAQDGLYHVVQAILARQRNDLDGFKTAMAEAEKFSLESIGYLSELVILQGLNQDAAARVATIKKITEVSKPRTPSRLTLGHYLVQQEKFEEAMTEFDRILRESEDYFPAVLQVAQLLRRKKDFEGALDLAGRVIAIDPTHPEAPQVKAQVLFDQGKSEEAIKVLEDLVNLTGYPTTKFILARIHLLQNKLSEGRRRLVEVLEAMPNYAPAAMLLAQVQIQTGEAEKAEALIREVLQSDPSNPHARVLLAKSFETRKMYPEAGEIYKQWTENEPKAPFPFYQYSMILGLQKKYDEAYAAVEQAYKLQPRQTAYQARMVEINALRGRYDEAQAQAELLIKAHDTWQARLLLGRVLSSQQKWNESREQLFKALDIAPGTLPVYELLVGTYLAEENPEKAIAELEDLIKANAKSAKHYLLLAMLYEKRQEFPKAAETYESMLKAIPTEHQAMNNLAYLYATELDKLEEAEKLARSAVKNSPDASRPAANDTLGWVFYKRGKYAEALTFIERAAQELSNVPEIQYHLGMARIKMGLLKEATQALELAVAGDGEYKGKEIAAKELEALRDPTQRAKFVNEEQLLARIAKNSEDADAHVLLAGLRRDAGKIKEAISSLDTATMINPRLITAWISLAELHGDAGELDKAIKAGRMASRLDDADKRAAAVLGRLALRRGKAGDLSLAYRSLKIANPSPQEPTSLYAYAFAAYLQGQLPQAQELMKQLTEGDSDSTEKMDALSFLTLTSPPEGNWSSLTAAIGNRLSSNPRDIPALMAQARIAPKKAVQSYESVLAQQTDYIPARLGLAIHLARDAKTVGRAEALIREVRDSLENSPEVFLVQGAISFRRDDADLALTYLRRIAPPSAEAKFYIGMTTMKKGQEERGAAMVKESLREGLPAILEKEAQAALGIDE